MQLRRSRLKPDEKVNVAVYISDACVRVCADSIKDRERRINKKKLMKRVRARIDFGKRREREA